MYIITQKFAVVFVLAMWLMCLWQVTSRASYSGAAPCTAGIWLCVARSKGNVPPDGTAAVSPLSCTAVPWWCGQGRSGRHGGPAQGRLPFSCQYNIVTKKMILTKWFIITYFVLFIQTIESMNIRKSTYINCIGHSLYMKNVNFQMVKCQVVFLYYCWNRVEINIQGIFNSWILIFLF